MPLGRMEASQSPVSFAAVSSTTVPASESRVV
jgi:hypothetical protein